MRYRACRGIGVEEHLLRLERYSRHGVQGCLDVWVPWL